MSISQSIVGGELYRDRVLRDGAVGYWRLGDAVGSGTVADLAGGHTGTVVGGVTLGQAGAIADGDTAALFDGSSGKVTVADAVPLKIVGDLTIEFWINGTWGSTRPVVICKGAAAGKEYYLVIESSGCFNFYCGGGNIGFEPVSALSPNVMQHAVITRNITTKHMLVYVNGIQKDDKLFSAMNPIASTEAVIISGRGAAGYLSGVLDEVALYPIALTAQQVAAHYGLRLAASRGGLVMGGAATIRRGVRVTGSGGMATGGGAATITRGVSVVGSGGVVVGGAAVTHGWAALRAADVVVQMAADDVVFQPSADDVVFRVSA